MDEGSAPLENAPLREPSAPPAKPAVPSLLGLGPAWTRVGYGVFALAVLAFVLLLAVHPIYTPVKGQPIPEGYRLVAKGEGAPYLKATPDGMLAVFALVFSALAGFVWTLVDVVDRRRRFVWLLPMFICPLTGLHALPLALYLFFGRETPEAGTNVQ